MIGMMLTERERVEFDYVLRKELDEMLLDLSDSRLEEQIRTAICERYRVILRMYARFAPLQELPRYAPHIKKYQ
mgnify:CR=1 FL=1